MVWPEVQGEGWTGLKQHKGSYRGDVWVSPCTKLSADVRVPQELPLTAGAARSLSRECRSECVCVRWLSWASAFNWTYVCVCASKGQICVTVKSVVWFLSHLVAFIEQELRQVGTILKRQETVPIKTSKTALQIDTCMVMTNVVKYRHFNTLKILLCNVMFDTVWKNNIKFFLIKR